ncbi:phosphatidylinositol-specific phospholipase C1-like protein [Terriglobus roseus]|uniref:Phosphoinositide phospholipase C, Ca2+-dependent n=1 Tax=Terriglobus roseus TaxID=392734 RepID=A0A1H4JSX0_9BACT|nr:phosphatidylinositol-specific phospholipase C1-like protein [Terriglobus roseus]SEB49227.1 Phosphoinositide phospholipase C, Ca2+-dependent [Terriglobus roseus]
MKLFALAVMAVAAALPAQSKQDAAQQDKTLKLNQIQVIGSHNSYNLGFAPSEAAYLKSVKPKSYESLEYSHKSLANQLDGGVRQLEIDVFPDPQGGRFAHPSILRITKEKGLPEDPYFDPKHEMEKPGIKVIHVQDLNQRSSCPLFTECLKQVRDWSKAHPNHVPLFLLIENKSGKSNMPGGVDVPLWTKTEFDALDKEIRSVFSDKEMILPDQVRGSYPTLREAVLAGHWPTLAESRGKVIFLMDQRNASPVYLEGHPNLKGRVLFTHAIPSEPDAAFVEMNGGTQAEIDAVIKQGFIVRTRTDEGTVAARDNNTTRRDEVLSSGATMISTDYPLSEPSVWSGYSVGFPDGMPVRCNPISAPKTCKEDLLEPGAKSAGKPSVQHHP